VFEIRAVADPITSFDASNTETLIPSRPSLVSSVLGVTVKVAEVDPAAIVTVPESETKSPAVALSTEPPLVSPITLYVNVVSDVGAEEAVIVYVIELPSATLEAPAERCS